MRHLEIEVTNAAELLAAEAYGAGALLRWERSATETGTYAEGGTVALVSGTSLYDVWDAAGIETTWYRTRISNAGGTTFSAYTTPLSPVTSVVSVAEVRALVNSRLSDIDLQAVIDREEAWLADKVGTLTGERTDTWTPGLGDTPLYLQRRAESVVLVDNGRTLAASEFLFTPSTGMIRRVWASDFVDRHRVYLGWAGDVTATYTPSDTAAVKRAVIELIRGTVGETVLDSESIGDYSYTRGESTGRVGRAGLARSILLRRPAYSMRLRPGWEPA